MAVFIDLLSQDARARGVNQELQREVAARQQAQEALQQVNQELELRVAERTAALTVAHLGVKENEERLRMAMDVAEIAAWEWDDCERPHDLVSRAGSPLRISRRVVRRRPARLQHACIPTTGERVQDAVRDRDRQPARPTSASTASCVPMA